MFVCFEKKDNKYTVIDTDDFSIETLSQDRILNYQNKSNDRVRVLFGKVFAGDSLAVIYYYDEGEINILVLIKGSTDYILITIEKDCVEYSVSVEGYDICIECMDDYDNSFRRVVTVDEEFNIVNDTNWEEC